VPGIPRNGSPGSDWVVAWFLGDRDPAGRRELVEDLPGAEAAPPGGFDAAERGGRLVVDGGTVDVADARLDPGGDRLGALDVPAEDRGGQPVFGVVGQPHRVVDAVGGDHRNDRAKRLLAVEPHL